ncbi:hypothetical protein MMC25_002893 [Agyrium rufum]|nr:hypothetical protein [Agyrium rufum]
MAATDDEEDFFDDDDDLDGITSHEFYELQERALRSTQNPQQNFLTVPELPNPSPSTLQQVTDAAPSSDYGDLDEDDLVPEEEVLEVQNGQLVEPQPLYPVIRPLGESSQREHWRQQRYGSENVAQLQHPTLIGRYDGRNTIVPQISTSRSEQLREDGDAVMLDAEHGEYPNEAVVVPDNSKALRELQAKVEELTREKTSLEQAVKAANDNAFTKAGEAAIIRGKQEKTAKEYAAQITSIQRAHTDALAKQKSEIEAAKVEAERLATKNKYLEHDLQEESVRLKQLQRNAKAGTTKPGAGQSSTVEIRSRQARNTTPKKNRTQDFGDGFDTVENAFIISPAKHGRRQKQLTPKAGEKRKRKAVEDSPGLASRPSQPPAGSIILDDEDTALEFPDLLPSLPEELRQPVAVEKPKKDQRYKVMQLVLNHQFLGQKKTSLDKLADYTYPSDPSTSVSSLLLAKLASIPQFDDLDDFPTGVCMILVSLWSKCLDEQHYSPLDVLLPLLQYLIILNAPETALRLVDLDKIVELAQLTADLTLIPRHKRQPLAIGTSQSHTTQAFHVLHLLAYNVTQSPPTITRFWRAIRFDFILMSIQHLQPVEDIRTTLSLLHTSILASSFAMIVAPSAGSQDLSESHVIDRLALLLIETPKPHVPQSKLPSKDLESLSLQNSPPRSGEQAKEKPVPIMTYTPLQVASIRQSTLNLLNSLSETRYGHHALATNAYAIGRLVRCASDTLDATYQLSPTISPSPTDEKDQEDDWQTPSLRDAYIGLVNTSILLLHDIVYAAKDGRLQPDDNIGEDEDLVTGTGNANQETANIPSYPETDIDLPAKLAKIQGGHQKFIIVLTRLGLFNASSQNSDAASLTSTSFTTAGGGSKARAAGGGCVGVGFLEEGIEEEVQEAAVRLLEDYVTPEEAEGIQEAFLGGSGALTMTTMRDGRSRRGTSVA